MENIENLVIERLCVIRSEIGRVLADMREVEHRSANLGAAIDELKRDGGDLYSICSSLCFAPMDGGYRVILLSSAVVEKNQDLTRAGRISNNLSDFPHLAKPTMPIIRMRPKHQVTLPASIVRAANIKPDDRLNVAYVNGSIIITPAQDIDKQGGLTSYAGIGRGIWGTTPAQVDQSLSDLKDSWER
jgi:bifunctional DNA-binding transcriptional regulator/antitoxin component of YhaV-PrlF toxin-antitoxin module